MSVIKPVFRQSAEAQAIESLRDYILSGAIKPGARLTEIGLASQLGVGRATIRTTLHRLAGEGIVVQTPYTGWNIATLTPKDVWELWTLRGSLEGTAAKLVAERISDSLGRRLRKALELLREACRTGDIKRVNDADFALHRIVIDSVEHERLSMQYGIVEQQVRLFIVTSNALAHDHLDSIVAQHEPLIDAILAGNPSAAQAEAWLHNETEGKKLLQSLAVSERKSQAADA